MVVNFRCFLAGTDIITIKERPVLHFKIGCEDSETQAEGESIKDGIFKEAEPNANALENLRLDPLNKFFCSDKYGSYCDNIIEMIEHSRYHLGQIKLLAKLLR